MTNKPKKEICGFMILTPTPVHNGGMWCAEPYPCKHHGEWKDHLKTPAVSTFTNSVKNGRPN